MRETWEHRIRRAAHLADEDDNARGLLTFYTEVLTLQKQLGDDLRRLTKTPSGTFERDRDFVCRAGHPLIDTLATHGPSPLADEARLLTADRAALCELLSACWEQPCDRSFFAKAILQPYAQWLAECGIEPNDRNSRQSERRCPFCGGAPQASILEVQADGDGAVRRLLCATCLSKWPCRRVMCVHCGEEDERRLTYFHSPSFDHLRLDVCDTCRHYIKSIDRTRLGIAVPLVDEVAGAPLDVWARDRGYEKIELNLVGL